MGLDIALGVIIFIGAIRGWYRGFLLQAIRLGGIVGSVYLAAPIRNLARPYVAPNLATIRPDMLDRMLWWASAIVCYLVVVGVVTMFINLQRRRPYGDPEVGRADQGAGFLLAGAKSALVMAFLVASFEKNGTKWAESVPWANEQVRTSIALAWERQYRPADQIWESPPVHHFIAYVRQMGITGGGDHAISAELAPASLLNNAFSPNFTLPKAARVEVPEKNPRLGLPSYRPTQVPPDASEAEVAAQVEQTNEEPGQP